MTESNEPSSDSTVERALGDELLQIHHDSYGGSAKEARIYIHGDVVFCVLDGLELMRNEEFLVGAGHQEAVISVRTQYQQAIKPTFSAAVERATGRRVISFLSTTGLDPNYAIEVFRLAPLGAVLEELPDE